MWDENRPLSSDRRAAELKPAERFELATARPALKELNRPVQPRPDAPEMKGDPQPAPAAKPGTPSRFDAVRALDEDENWRERTEVITKHDHNLNKQLARDIIEQIVDSAASTPTESSSSVSFATVSSNPPAPVLPGTLPDVVRVAAASPRDDTDSGDSSEYESASEQEDAPAAPSTLRSETSLLADELLGLSLQTPLKPGAPPRPQSSSEQKPQQQWTLDDLPPPSPLQELIAETDALQVSSAAPRSGETGERAAPVVETEEAAAEGATGEKGESETEPPALPEPAVVTEECTPSTEEHTPSTEECIPAPVEPSVAQETLPAPEEPAPVAEEPTPAVAPTPAVESVTVQEEPAPTPQEEPAATDAEQPPAQPECDAEPASTEVRADSPPIRAASPPIRAASPPIRAASPPIRSASPPIRSASPPIKATTPPTRSDSPPIRSASPPIRAASPPIRSASPPIRSGSPPIRSASPPIRSGSPPIRSGSPPIRSGSPPIRAGSPPIRSGSPPIRSGSPPIRPAGAMTQTGDEDEPIPPKVGYNLDFLDDPNFNPFTTGSGIKLSPPPSPKASLPPLKAAKTKKQREAAPADPAPAETNGVGSSDGGSAEPANAPEQTEEPVKPPAKKPVVKKPVRPVRRPLKKKVVEPPPEPTPAPSEENGRADSPPLAPPSKGYNLDFLDNCDDPNFNPFATKSAVANSPTGSPTAARKVANSPPLPARSAAKQSPVKPAAKAAPPPEPEPEPEEPEPQPEPAEEPQPEEAAEEPAAEPEEPMDVKTERPDPLGGGDASTSVRSEASRTALLDTAPLDFGEVTGSTINDQEMASATNDQFVEATNFFQDPSALDRLAEHRDGRLAPNIARNSLYVKFDPLLGRPSVLPEIQRLTERAEESASGVPRQLTSVKSDLIAFSPKKEDEQVPTPPPVAAPAAPAPAPAAASAVPADLSASQPPTPTDGSVAELLKKQELYFQDQLLKRDREMTAMKNANAKLIQQASSNKTEKVLERVAHLVASLTNENGRLRHELNTDRARLVAERDEARQEVANAEAMFADLHRKYEKSKAVLQEHRRCADQNQAAFRDAKERAEREKQRFDMLRQHSEDAHARLEADYEAAEKAHQTELLTLKAKLQLAENREAKLERENREITAICDELIQKMGAGAAR
ncbi:nascent polypeptide-associated complex subunit alpha, muscle-specific form-like isoform X3 [Amphibalanus amphitrite]|nr:nascent polypeptide-associated complex subunit alpha, muscle-specific form-like isoform X2 [Amphibalanus amphitrite]XP_043206592.1 nascent polypeptide-associated complex subunit alpha, muscle-specific form-like isoform X2 [Amphibalanus amphitrite]XP_043206593.1 nascent polypeptide-associated complex subunit alpha, muscle-specific form-like isoform X3 [Amphibalanus amphitrite]